MRGIIYVMSFSLFLHHHKTIMRYVSATAIAMLVTTYIEYLFGRVLMCTCGYIKLWHGAIWSKENSQHVTDWYTFSHVIHGFIFYYFGKYVLKKLTLFQTFVVALGIESIWEITENSSIIIERYRTATVSLDYFGDSIINSLIDILAMVLGFYLAKKLPLWVILSLTIIVEIGALYVIRDNLALNILMLLSPVEEIRMWQIQQVSAIR